MTGSIFLPDLVADWKWPRSQNPHYAEAKRDSEAWIRSFKAFEPKAQRAFDKCNFSLLTSLAYPSVRKESLRSACDLMNLFFVIDEHTDVASANEARQQIDIVKDAMHNPDKPRPQGEWVGGEVARQFWSRVMKLGSPKVAEMRFIQTFDWYLDQVITQAEDRDNSHLRDIEGYARVRKHTIGTEPSFSFVLVGLGLQLSDEVLEHPVIREITDLCSQMIWIGNDLASYNKEQACGDNHNIVPIVMAQLGVDAQTAINWAADLHRATEQQFYEAYSRIPRWGGPIDLEVQTYIHGLANWVRASDQWNFESERYFGTKGLEVFKVRFVDLMPKKAISV